jgi:hypothetical protein
VKAGVEQGQTIEAIAALRIAVDKRRRHENNYAKSSWTRLLLSRQLWHTLELVRTAFSFSRESSQSRTFVVFWTPLYARFGKLNRGCYGFLTFGGDARRTYA